MKRRTKEEMAEYQRRRRAVTPDVTPEKNGVTPGENVTPKAVTPTICNTQNGENVTPNVTPKCEHKPIVAHEGARPLVCSARYGPALPDVGRYMEEVPEAKMVKCPCCGKEWKCGRPDIQSAYCLKCDKEEVEDWRGGRYKRPPMEPKEVLGGFMAGGVK